MGREGPQGPGAEADAAPPSPFPPPAPPSVLLNMRFSTNDAAAAAGTDALAALTSLNRPNTLRLMHEVGRGGVRAVRRVGGQQRAGLLAAALPLAPSSCVAVPLTPARANLPSPVTSSTLPQIVKRLGQGEARALGALDDLLMGLDIRWGRLWGGRGGVAPGRRGRERRWEQVQVPPAAAAASPARRRPHPRPAPPPIHPTHPLPPPNRDDAAVLLDQALTPALSFLRNGGADEKLAAASLLAAIAEGRRGGATFLVAEGALPLATAMLTGGARAPGGRAGRLGRDGPWSGWQKRRARRGAPAGGGCRRRARSPLTEPCSPLQQATSRRATPRPSWCGCW
jgi:hypothetical protein